MITYLCLNFNPYLKTHSSIHRSDPSNPPHNHIHIHNQYTALCCYIWTYLRNCLQKENIMKLLINNCIKSYFWRKILPEKNSTTKHKIYLMDIVVLILRIHCKKMYFDCWMVLELFSLEFLGLMLSVCKGG